jgi:hypothetical protein
LRLEKRSTLNGTASAALLSVYTDGVFLALKSWQWMPELVKTTTAGYCRDLKPRALQP